MTGSELPRLEDDGLTNLPVGSWAEEKYRLVGLYASLFSASMKAKWDHRVYVDLFAGPGRSQIKDSGRVVPGTPTLALSAPTPYTRYIFCEKDHASLETLKARCDRDFPERDVRYVPGDCNQHVAAIISHLPIAGRGSTVLSFCFADPFRVSDLHFATLTQLAERYVDFLILIPTGMDASRNWRRESPAIDSFVGTPAWRGAWTSRSRQGVSFDAFFTGFFSTQMATLGYAYGGVNNTVLIRNPDKNQRLYRLAFYSKHQLGEKFWTQALRYSTPQLGLDL